MQSYVLNVGLYMFFLIKLLYIYLVQQDDNKMNLLRYRRMKKLDLIVVLLC